MQLIIRNWALACFILLFNINTYGQPEIYIPENGEDTMSVKLPEISDIDRGLNLLLPPKVVTASDGTYDKYVKVIWNALPKGYLYKTYRSDTPEFSEKVEISNGWKKSNWLQDSYRLVPGKKYYYQVVAGWDSQNTSEPSESDSGFIPKNVFAAPNGKSGTSSVLKKKGAALSLSAEFAYFEDQTVTPGENLVLPYIVNNAGTTLLSDKTIFFVISTINSNDTETDKVTLEVLLPPMPADSNHRNVVKFKVPTSLSDGIYRLKIKTKEKQDNTLFDSRLLTVESK